MFTKRSLNLEPFSSPLFRRLPLSAQALFFHMVLRAGKNGTLPLYLARMGLEEATQQDLDILLNNGFVHIMPNNRLLIDSWYSYVDPTVTSSYFVPTFAQ